ncbi:MAG TPA: heme oxygenase, partial [Planctomycetaceae bacterium]|nr:heme oxygenase [Planctomycetaceae bacterium]
MHPNLLRIKALLAPQREKLLNHPIYEHIKKPIHVRTFMTQHVFAVWDFMSLLKSLQQRFCGCDIPWHPEKQYPLAVRLINEIVLAEESDVGPTGQFLSHYEMYRMAMVQAGASTKEIDMLILGVQANKDLNEILDSRKLPSHICSF